MADRPVALPPAKEESTAVAQHIIHPLFELDIRDPSFRSAASSWAVETRCEMDGMVAETKRMIARTKVILAEARRKIRPLP